MEKQADEIRQYASKNCVRLAKLQDQAVFSVVAGDVHRRMGLRDRVPNVCSALGSKQFLRSNNLVLVKREGPPSGKSSTVKFTYAFLSTETKDLEAGPHDPSGGKEKGRKRSAKEEAAWNEFLSMRGIAKGVWDEYGGGEEFLRREREAWVSPADLYYEERDRDRERSKGVQ